MGGDHDHGTGLARAGERHRGRLTAAFVVILVFFVVEVVAGLITNSLALLSDAGHMLTDVIGLGMALAAIQLASRFADRHSEARNSHTFGLYRLEILAAFVNAPVVVRSCDLGVDRSHPAVVRRTRSSRCANAGRCLTRPGSQPRGVCPPA